METKTTKAAATIAAVFLVAAAAFAQPPADTIPADEAGGGVYFGEPATLQTLERLKDSGQWTLEAKTVLAQALWGEAGIRREYSRTVRRNGRRGRVVPCGDENAGPDCYPNRDWRLIPWVLLKRWEDVRGGGSRITFVGLVRAYSSPVRPALASDQRMTLARAMGDQREVRQVIRRRFLQALRFDGSNLVEARRRYGFRAPLDLHRGGWEEITDVVDRWGEGNVPNPCPDARHWDSFAGAVTPGMIRVCEDLETLNAFYAFPRRRSPES